jgi:hypothetical protein
MGHNRLGILPKTYRWQQVIQLLEEGADVSDIADASFEAAQAGLAKIPKDSGFLIALTNIFHFIESAKSKNLTNALWEHGFPVPKDVTLLDLASSLRQKTDIDLIDNKAQSDVGEIAQNAFSEALFKNASADIPNFFEATAQSTHETLKTDLSGKRLTGILHEFYAVFTRRYLTYYLSRELSNHVGPGRLLGNINEHEAFNRAFDVYIRQTVKITKEFNPGWLSKAIHEQQLSRESVKRYAHGAFKKIIGEFNRDARADG